MSRGVKPKNCKLRYHVGSRRQFLVTREPEIPTPAGESTAPEKSEWTALRMITWFSAGMAVAAIGIFLGNELRNRARFKKRTPYDFYSNAGEQQASEFGMGI
jgi:hypothetical protein